MSGAGAGELPPIGQLRQGTLELLRFRAMHYRDAGAIAVLEELEAIEAPRLPLEAPAR